MSDRRQGGPTRLGAAIGLVVVAAALGFVAFDGPRVRAEDAPGPVEFARDLEPLLKQQCAMCHNETVAQAGLRLDSREMALKGGVSGPAIVPGNAQASPLLRRLLGVGGGLRMPQNL